LLLTYLLIRVACVIWSITENYDVIYKTVTR